MNLMISSATFLTASSNPAMTRKPTPKPALRFTTMPQGLRSYVILDHGEFSPITQGFCLESLQEAQKHCEELEQRYAAK